ncbi:hypothetical protein Clacol_003112 [Clathrus columnatus]|uniref:MFS general substrate transporter n=1 Tax=Clathrus columnatus TaxID=1419009 RepID=A0AAV5A5X2_9AGAM|nr:hypothetical protein Clacol_003112 [Clathrus columnatus]
MESKDRSTMVPETQSLLDPNSPYSPIGKTTEVAPKEVTGSDSFPEGGTKAWASVAGSFCMVSISKGAIYAFGVYQDFYAVSVSPPSPISESAYLLVIREDFSFWIPRFFMLSLAQPHNYYQVFLAQGVGVGLGMGLVYLPSVTLGFHYFKCRRGVAVGIVSAGSAVGGIFQTIGLNHLINGKVGFSWGVRIFGFIFLVLAIIGNILMRPRLPPRRLRPNQPKPDVEKIVRDIPLLLSIVGSALLLFSAFFPFFYIQLFAILHGISTNLAFYLVRCYFSLASSTISTYVDNTHEIGFALGYALFIESFFVLIAQPVAGAIVDAPRYRWNRAIIAVSLILYGGFAMVLVSRMMLVRQRKTWKV